MNKATLILLTIGISLSITGVESATINNAHSMQDGQVSETSENVKLPENLLLKITVGDKEGIATFIDSETTRDFIKRLPLTLRMDDLGNREKYGALSEKLSIKGLVKTTYQKGDISYWLGGGLATFYNQDDHRVKAGLIVLARLEKGIDLFTGPESINVTFDVIKKQ